MKQSLYIIIIFISVAATVCAQSAYKGGAGDGHAMAEWTNRPVGIVNPQAEENIRVYPSILHIGEEIFIQSDAPVKVIRLLNVNGRILNIISSSSNGDIARVSTDGISAGIYYLQVIHNKNINTYKVILTN